MITRTPWIVVALLSSVGCESEPGGLSLEEMGDTLGESICARIFRCCDESGIARLFPGTFNTQAIRTEALCVDYAVAFHTEPLQRQYAESLAQQRIAYDAEAAAACVAAIRGARCGELSVEASDEPTPGCAPFITPLVPEGGTCEHDYECTTDLCAWPAVPGGPRVCEPRRIIGQACDISGCVPGSFCDTHTPDGMAICAVERSTGQVCHYEFECESGDCSSAPQTPGTCRPSRQHCDGNL